jgi:methylase of polypeptide subunit release factors
VGLDVSVPALKIAKKNANKLKADISFKKFDLLNDKLSSVFNPQSSICILANLPYVPNDFHINLAASHEPAQAIFGGYDGLDLYRKLFEQLSTPTTEAKHITVFTESLPQQHGKLPKIAKYAGFELVKSQDFIQVFKRN